jgi:serine/threonine protein kinase
MDDDQTLRSMVRDDAYRVVRVLGDGASGRTELVTFNGEGLLVRKHIPAALANAAAWAVAMEVDEPLLPRIEELYRMPDELVVVYDYVEGEAVNEVVEQEGRLEAPRAVGMLVDVCRAVSALHERDVVHRDITPGNVILASDGAHLVDLGIARQKRQGQRRDTTTLGTWGFAAPEQYGFMQTDARSDVYALGRLLGYALTGEKPDTDAYETALSDRSIVPEALYDVVQKATAFEPSARYQTAGELARAAQEALTGMPLPEPVPEPVPTPEAAPQPAHPQAPIRRASRSFMEAPLYLRALAALAWIALVVGFLIVLAASVTYWTTNAPIWHAEQYVMAVVVDAGIAYLCFEIYKAVCLRGAYATERHPVRLFVTRICIYTLIIFLVMMALGIFVSYLREG